MYNSYTLHTSTIQCPPFKPPSSSVLDRSLIELELKKPSFLINHEESLKQPFSSSLSLNPQKYQLSKQSLARLQRLQRNPFFKNSRIHPKYPQYQSHKNSSWLTQSSALLTPHPDEQTRDIIVNLEKEYFKKFEPAKQQEQQQDKEFRVEEILTEIGRQHYPESPRKKVEEQKQKNILKINSQPISQQQYQEHNQWVMPRQLRIVENQEPLQPFIPLKQTATIIHQLTQDHLQNSKQIVSSQVQAFGSPQAEREDPITFWAKREVESPKRSKVLGLSEQIPEYITLRGIKFDLIRVS